MGHFDGIFFFSTVKNNIVFEVEHNGLLFRIEGETQYDYLTSSLSWYVVSNPSWITVNPSSGSGSANLQITASSNLGGSYRYGAIQLSNNSTTIIIDVEQDGAY